MTARENRQPMTVAQIREALAGLPDDTVPSWSSWDSEYDYTHIYGIHAISPAGVLDPVLTDGYAGWEDDDDEDAALEEELTAEQATAAAASAEALYHEPSFSNDANPDGYIN